MPADVPLRPPPPLPEPDPVTEGGGGTTAVPIEAPVEETPRADPVPVALPVSDPFTEGGGGTTFEVIELRRELPVEVPVPLPEAEGGGGMTLAARVTPGFPWPLRAVPDAFAVGGTISCVPKSLPMMLLTKPVLAACVGAGGTTVGDEASVPLSSRRRSWEESAEGGGATTAGAGMLSLAFLPISRSGEETGGGTTAAFICTRVGATSLASVVGAGGTIFAFSVGAERTRSCEMRVEAGPITLALRVGAVRLRSRETLGAGAMIDGSSLGAKSGCSDCTVGVGGTTAAFSSGAVRDLLAKAVGAGGTTASRVTPLRDWARVTLVGAGATTLAGRRGAVSEECRPSDGGGPGMDLKASRLATAPGEECSFRSGASTIWFASELPRATWMV